MNYNLLREVIFGEDNPLIRAVTRVIGDEVARYTDSVDDTYESYLDRVYNYAKSAVNGLIPRNMDVLSLLFGEEVRNIKMATTPLTVKVLKVDDSSSKRKFILRDEKSNIEYSL